MTRRRSGEAPAAADALAAALVRWYRRHARDLPWRRDAADPVTGPYRVWVSEIMLQQTQVATVVPYYHRWMAAFPTVADLAAADLETVLGHWSGLGYYARCRNLHRAAQAVARDHRGVVPRDPAALAALPGVGPYTLGAIRSIAFGDPVPLVDGNVIRVLSRLDALEGDPASGPVKAALWARAGALVETGGDPSALNQALMELGATVCTPTGPACLLCPVSASCLARRQGREAELPQVARRPRRRRERAFCAVATRADRVLLARRPATGLLGGLWEPPRVPEAAARAGRRLGTVTHVFTHIELKLEVFALEVAPRRRGPPTEAGCYEARRWIPRGGVDAVPLSTLARKVLALAGIPAGDAGA